MLSLDAFAPRRIDNRHVEPFDAALLTDQLAHRSSGQFRAATGTPPSWSILTRLISCFD
ncbi:hypothetical protein RRSWK_05311 [Rhodopirellula sp. SWK7]|nr:hypothetical protein RRSWK_05311 [Rhodopirellula sp. SWK7]